MKKTISIILASVLAFSLISCSRIIPEEETLTNETAEETSSEADIGNSKKAVAPVEIEKLHDVDGVFSVGFEKADITPMTGCPLGGYPRAGSRLSKVILDKLYLSFVAFQDKDGQRGLLMTIDNLGLNNTVAKNLMNIFANEAGVPLENVIISATHTHSAPAIDIDSNPSIVKYISLIIKHGKIAVRNAFNSLDEAEIYIGSEHITGMNQVRRFVDANGKYAGNNMGSSFAHETEADNELQIIKFDRKNEKDIVIANWQAHPTMTSQECTTEISSDYITGFRDYMENEIGVDFAFYEGAAGNQTVSSSAMSDKTYQTEIYIAYGKELGIKASEIMQNMTKVESGAIKGKEIKITAEYKKGFEKKGSQTMKTTVFGFGDIAFVAAPYEMFSQNGKNVKTNSPFKMTFICEQANGKNGYLPSSDVYDHGGYEIDKCYFVKGTAEAFESAFISSLAEIH